MEFLTNSVEFRQFSTVNFSFSVVIGIWSTLILNCQFTEIYRQLKNLNGSFYLDIGPPFKFSRLAVVYKFQKTG